MRRPNRAFLSAQPLNHLRLAHIKGTGKAISLQAWTEPKGLTLSQLMLHICRVSKTFGEWYQKTNKTEDANKLTLLAFKIIAILHNTLLATFI
jgi:hypothetical protein